MRQRRGREPARDTKMCLSWNRDNDYGKTDLVLGWILGVEAALTLVTMESQVKYLWPTGHRVGSVKLELGRGVPQRPGEHDHRRDGAPVNAAKRTQVKGAYEIKAGTSRY